MAAPATLRDAAAPRLGGVKAAGAEGSPKAAFPGWGLSGTRALRARTQLPLAESGLPAPRPGSRSVRDFDGDSAGARPGHPREESVGSAVSASGARMGLGVRAPLQRRCPSPGSGWQVVGRSLTPVSSGVQGGDRGWGGGYKLPSLKPLKARGTASWRLSLPLQFAQRELWPGGGGRQGKRINVGSPWTMGVGGMDLLGGRGPHGDHRGSGTCSAFQGRPLPQVPASRALWLPMWRFPAARAHGGAPGVLPPRTQLFCLLLPFSRPPSSVQFRGGGLGPRMALR